MGFWDKASKVSRAVTRELAGAFESKTRCLSRNKNLSEEQRDAYAQLSENMRDIRLANTDSRREQYDDYDY